MNLKHGIITLFFLGLIAGCGSQGEEYKNFLRLRLKDDPTTLDPAYVVDVPGGALAAKLYNGLVRFDRDGRIVPDLAERWEISEDGRTYRFQLREGVAFDNGREATADDFVYSFRRLLDPEVNSPRFWLLESVKGASEFREEKTDAVSGLRAEGSSVLEIELEEPSSLFLDYLAMPNAAVVPKEAVEKWGPSFADHPVGTGPFRLKEWRHNNRLILEKRPAYFEGEPRLAGVLYRVIPEDLTAAVEFEQGSLDILEVPRAEFGKYSSREPYRGWLRDRVGLNIYYLGFNCRQAPFDDYRIRRAFNYAIDRRKIIKVLLEGRAVPARGPVPPRLLSPRGEGYRYDPAKARQLLAERGVGLPLKVRFLFKSDREVLSIAEVIQDYLKQVGIEAVLVQREWSSFKEAVDDGDFDLFYLSWWGDYPDAENFLYPTFHSDNWGAGGNRTRFADPQVDAVLDRTRLVTDPAARRKLLANVQKRVVRLAPWVFLWYKKEYVIVRPRVKGFRIPIIYNGEKFAGLHLE